MKGFEVGADLRRWRSAAVTCNEVGLAAAVAGIRLVSMTVGAGKKEIADRSLVRVLQDWDKGEIELHAVFPAGKASKAGRAPVHRLPHLGIRERSGARVSVGR